MERTDLIRKIQRGARAKGTTFTMLRQGGSHEVWTVTGGRSVTIPRHKAINEMTNQKIMRDLEGTLGKDWSR